jgi:hypothetical protein
MTQVDMNGSLFGYEDALKVRHRAGSMAQGRQHGAGPAAWLMQERMALDGLQRLCQRLQQAEIDTRHRQVLWPSG